MYNGTASIYLKDEDSNILGTLSLPVLTPYVDSSTSLRAAHMVSKYYQVLQNNIFSDIRVIEDAEFYLNPKDISEYNPFIPVYIDYFGAYFYINKIKNFVSGKLTKVDLVKI